MNIACYNIVTLDNGWPSVTLFTQQERLQKVFEVLHSHRQQQEELGTIAYQLPAHFLTHSGGHVTELHRPSPTDDTDQFPHLERSVSVRGVANDFTHSTVVKCVYDTIL